MSAEATFRAWEQSCSGNNKLVLLCLADYANDDRCAWPSKRTIAKSCGISETTVKVCIKNLIDDGLIKEIGTVGHKYGECKKYLLTIFNKKTKPIASNNGITREGGSESNGVEIKRGLNPPEGGSESDPNPTIEPTINNNLCGLPKKSEIWKQFFAEYPPNKKGGRDETAWKKAKSLKLADSDFVLMLADIQERKRLCPRWYSQYAPGICRYLGDHFWKTPIIEEKHESIGSQAKTRPTAAERNLENIKKEFGLG